MEIYKNLVGLAEKNQEPIKKLIVGVHWTLIESLVCGLASTQIEPPPHFNKQIEKTGKLKELKVGELASNLHSNRWLEASVGLAAINSSILINDIDCKQENAYDVIVRIGKGKNIGIIGHFPFVSKLKNIVANVFVIELQPQNGDISYDQISNILPKCDVVAITATTLINHTFDKVLSNCSPDAFKIMLGPSTPMTPLLFDYGVDMIAGCKVLDSEKTFLQIQEGANFKQITNVKVFTMSTSKWSGK